MAIENKTDVVEILKDSIHSLDALITYNWTDEIFHFAEVFEIEDDSVLDPSVIDEFEFTDTQKQHILYHMVQLHKLKLAVQASLDNKPSVKRL